MASKIYISIWIPKDLLEQIDIEARKQQRSRNWIIINLLSEKFSKKEEEMLCIPRL